MNDAEELRMSDGSFSALTDPEIGWVYAVHREDGSVAYVGQTVDFPAVRFRAHLRDALSGCEVPFHRWLRHAIVSGACPRVSTIETCPRGMLNERELFWIRHHHAEQAGETLNVAGVTGRRVGQPAPPLSSEEYADLRVILARARELANASEERAAMDEAEPYVRAIRSWLKYHIGTSPERVRTAALQINGQLKANGHSGEVEDRLVVSVAESMGFALRGEGRGHLVRLGTEADRLTADGVLGVDRAKAYLMDRSGRSAVIGNIRRLTLASQEDCERALVELGWTKRKGRGEWDPPQDMKKTG